MIDTAGDPAVAGAAGAGARRYLAFDLPGAKHGVRDLSGRSGRASDGSSRSSPGRPVRSWRQPRDGEEYRTQTSSRVVRSPMAIALMVLKFTRESSSSPGRTASISSPKAPNPSNATRGHHGGSQHDALLVLLDQTDAGSDQDHSERDNDDGRGRGRGRSHDRFCG